jgi:hypothetical protein
MKKASPFFETSETDYQVARRFTPEELNHQPHRCEDFTKGVPAVTRIRRFVVVLIYSGDVRCSVAVLVSFVVSLRMVMS